MADLLNKANINCQPDEIIFVKEQSINFLGSDSPKHVINNTECKNSISSKCFRQLAKNYMSYFNISKSCNGKDKCSLVYNDMYYSAAKFARSCDHSKGSDFYLLRIGVSNECFNYENQIIVRKNISEIRYGSLYLRSNETGRCLIRGSIESARILEQVNMRINVSDRKSRHCTELLISGSFIYDKDLSCLVGVNEFYLDIQTTKTRPRLWMEFKGTSLQLECGDNIQLPNELEQNDYSTLFPMIMGLVAGLLLLLAVVMIIIKRRNALTTIAETRHCTMTAGTSFKGICTYYNYHAHEFQDDVHGVQEISSSFDEYIYSMSNNDAGYEQIIIKENPSDFGKIYGEQSVKKETIDAEKPREDSRDSNYVTPRSINTTENKPNTFIGEVADNVYATVSKSGHLGSIYTEEECIYAEVSTPIDGE
ncbi:uncharacterized protein LOC128191910 [Crassostrea angulata]|uniref:uncharacterized protein LOC128191910 n=1 Tax=Magallana angulata TaxID=2784310 RepID=UPI0022B181DC|nr:uncharacterized protein LOC128191910 [Crassostrea angulata]